ncbi:MAG: tripartite tricarboxylate transporter substrate binding protein [Burkholderiaceae bacterium]
MQKTTTQRCLLSLSLALAALVNVLLPAQAAYPDKPVRLIVPFAPGGGTDMIARTLGAAMALELGQPVLIDNKPGAGTVIGSDLVAKSPADGYTLLIATFANAVNPSLLSKLPYAHDSAFTPIMLMGRSPNILVVRPDSPIKSVQDLIATAKVSPKPLTFASQGNGTSAHLAAELFKNLAKLDLMHIPYRGAGPALTDLLGGQVDLMFATAAATGAFIDSGRLRALAVTTAERSPVRPTVPTLAESGVPGYAAESWYGLVAPAGTPTEVITRLNAAARKAVQSENFRKKVTDEGLIISAGTPEEMARYVRGEEARWRKIVKENHISAD